MPLIALLLAGCAAAPGSGLFSAATLSPQADSAAEPVYPTRLAALTLTTAPQTSLLTSTPAASATPSPTPQFTAAATVTACPFPRGHIARGQIVSAILTRTFDYRVYLPPCYDARRAGGYPVLYFLHGQGMDDSAWHRFGAGETAARLIASGEAPPFLIVMPREDYYLEDMSQSNFKRALLGDLMPWIESNYAACPQRDCRAIGGLSRGALWSLMVALENPLLFSAAGAHSLPNPPFSPYLLSLLWEAVPQDKPLRLYIDIGEYDPLRPGAEEFQRRLESFHIPHEWRLNPGGHDDAYWMAHVEEYLRWYAAGWQQLERNELGE